MYSVMQQSSLVTLFMPISIGIIMLGMGLSLTPDDFRRVVKYPRAVLVGLSCQMLLLPLLCFGVVRYFELSPHLAVGLMLLSAAPGGPSANLFSHLSNGDVALNITLTAVNSVLALISLPLIVNASLAYFLDANQYVPMPIQKVIEVFGIVLLPVTIGMLIKHWRPGFAASMNKPVKAASALLLVLVIVAAILKEKSNIVLFIEQAGLPVLVFNVLCMLVGYFVPIALSVERRQAIAVSMEVGIHNATLAIYVALSVLNDSAASIPPAIYGVLMFVTAAIFGFVVSRRATTT